ncbi:hypothetical protein [Amycolatopsis thermophila]|uniref:Uncharacterized protein n=1 Tax=Amycolatopsis thermophila TaxID=206084 RepID=A0ABU0EL54_9PSEU|nr:hypothetical protein [Amycolatopsis thermophila]MDQ0376016.1 hypothetical protein [Amycolatopsis thermophila]
MLAAGEIDTGFAPFALSAADDGGRVATRFVDGEEDFTGVAFAQRYARQDDHLEPAGNPLLLQHRPEPPIPPAAPRPAAG